MNESTKQSRSARFTVIINKHEDNSSPDYAHRHYLLKDGISPLGYYDTVNNMLSYASSFIELLANNFSQDGLIKCDSETHEECIGIIENIIDDVTATNEFCKPKLCQQLDLDPLDETIFSVIQSQAFKAKGCLVILSDSFGQNRGLPNEFILGLLESVADVLSAASAELLAFYEDCRKNTAH